ncbi:hypothetical protein CBR_g46674 [Chara braunii]|uniref:Branched-chain-amino-acid aminotransferase n=1 Tax=Chara braunii TaxID=69332 RepID=A0A388M0Z7_CHABU|nr:hypothetical protein CBR_g46674 [Chara braunii]|eukprot:GBG88185.1 hypothetical protein CBR_g46674 [Chara braunii]
MAPNVPAGAGVKLSEAIGRCRGDSRSLDLSESGNKSNGLKVSAKFHKGLLVQTAYDLKPKPPLSATVNSFGRYATDHMLQIKWKRGEGWGTPSIKPVQAFELHPFAQVFHYALTCFEGMKVYKDAQGHGRLFRPMMNMNRLMVSASRLDLPDFDKEALLSYIKHLVKMDEEWIPGHEGYSLYVRPTIMATAALLGLAPPEECLLFVVMTPCGSFPNTAAEGFRELAPIKVLVSMEHVRAWPGGVGYAKVGGNYAPAIVPQIEARKFGCSQVLYVRRDECEGDDGIVGEFGAMNFFAFMQSKDGSLELVTPVLDGTILPGITRDSVLSLCREWGEFRVSERTLRFQEVSRNLLSPFLFF